MRSSVFRILLIVLMLSFVVDAAQFLLSLWAVSSERLGNSGGTDFIGESPNRLRVFALIPSATVFLATVFYVLVVTKLNREHGWNPWRNDRPAKPVWRGILEGLLLGGFGYVVICFFYGLRVEGSLSGSEQPVGWFVYQLFFILFESVWWSTLCFGFVLWLTAQAWGTARAVILVAALPALAYFLSVMLQYAIYGNTAFGLPVTFAVVWHDMALRFPEWLLYMVACCLTLRTGRIWHGVGLLIGADFLRMIVFVDAPGAAEVLGFHWFESVALGAAVGFLLWRLRNDPGSRPTGPLLPPKHLVADEAE